MKNKMIGVCPNCGANVVEREKGWFCESNPCRFVLWKDNAFFKRLGKRICLFRKPSLKLSWSNHRRSSRTW